ncbi:hypothetical protein HQ531_10420 [bacterium]|nr:hypothetical protein [bacterium]
MLEFKKLGLIVLLAGGLLLSCEEDESPPENILPLSGTYALYEMTINIEANTLRDTIVHFNTTQNGIDSIQIEAGTQVVNSSTSYSDQDSVPIGGTVILRNDGSAKLNGDLPVNVGSGCLPIIVILTLDSDGVWSADTTDGTFSVDLVFDALDIDGTYSLAGDQMEIRYDTIVENDERLITTVNYLGVDTAIEPGCVAVSTITERIMHLTLE